MNTKELVHFVSTGERLQRRSIPAAAPYCPELVRPGRAAMLRARQFLLSEQRSDGSWLSSQASDASLASQLIFLLAYRGDEQTSTARQAAAAILAQQSADGGWPRVPEGPADLSISVQAYLALKLTGLASNDERLARARVVIRQLGGADAADANTRYFMALFGQVGYDCCPVFCPEVLLRGQSFARNLAPLALVWSHRAVREIGIGRGVRELFIEQPSGWPALRSDAFANTSRKTMNLPPLAKIVNSTVTAILRYSERIGWTPLRSRALQRAEALLLQSIQPASIDRLDFSDLVWHAIALRAIGYSHDSRELQICEERLNNLVQIDDVSHRSQPRAKCKAEADTIAALHALGVSGLAPHHPCASAGVNWLRQHGHCEQTRLGSIELSQLLHAIGNAARNGSQDDDFLPGIQILHHHTDRLRRDHHHVVSHFGRFTILLVHYLIQQQNSDGGWGATSGSPSTPDATAAVLEALARCGVQRPLVVPQRDRAREPHDISRAIDRAVKYVRQAQRADGSWNSTTGVRLVHGTSLVVQGLLAAGVARDDDAVAAGINWLLAHQQPSGGWGESAPISPDRNRGEFVAGRATASQTAWALLALVAAGQSRAEAVRRGVHFLLETQDEDGTWRETPFVHHDPEVDRWYRSELHAAADPLLALSRWAVAVAENGTEADCAQLRLVGGGREE